MLEISPVIREIFLQLYIFKKLSIENDKILSQLLKIFNSDEKNAILFENVFFSDKKINFPSYKKVSGLLEKSLLSEYLLYPSVSFDKITKKFGAQERVFSDFGEFFSKIGSSEAYYHSLNLRMGYRKQEILKQSLIQKDGNNWTIDYSCNGLNSKNKNFNKIVSFHVFNGKILLKNNYSGFISSFAKLGFFDFENGLLDSLGKNDPFGARIIASLSKKINNLNLNMKMEELYSSIVKSGNNSIENILSLYSKHKNILEIFGNFVPSSSDRGSHFNNFSIEAALSPGAANLFTCVAPKNFGSSSKYNLLMKDFSPLLEIKYYDASDGLYLGNFNFEKVMENYRFHFNCSDLQHYKNDNSIGIFDFNTAYNKAMFEVHLKRDKNFIFLNNMDFDDSFKIFFGLAYPSLCAASFFANKEKDLVVFKNKLVDYNANLMFFLINQRSIIKIFSPYLISL